MADLGRAIAAERAAFADTLERLGPDDAPTLAGTWTAADVAAHVLSLDRFGGVATAIGRTLVARGIRLNDRAAAYADRGLQSTKRKGFEWAVRSFRTPGPRLLLRERVAPVGLFEVFVHHEDVRRGRRDGDPQGRPVPPELVESIRWLLRYHSSLLDGLRLTVARRSTRGRRRDDRRHTGRRRARHRRAARRLISLSHPVVRMRG